MRKTTFLFTFFTCIFFQTIYAQTETTFNWDTPTPIVNGANVTQSIDEITTTFIGTADAGVTSVGNAGGSSGDAVLSSVTGTQGSTSVTFNFSTAVDVTSVIALDIFMQNIDYTFTPTGGSNSPVVASLSWGLASVSLNWTGVTSFTVSSPTSTVFGFDNLIINNPALSTNTPLILEKTTVYPNPVQDFLYITNIENLNSVKVYNNIGQLVIESTEEKINFSDLNSGVYFIQISTEKALINKRIIKK